MLCSDERDSRQPLLVALQGVSSCLRARTTLACASGTASGASMSSSPSTSPWAPRAQCWSPSRARSECPISISTVRFLLLASMHSFSSSPHAAVMSYPHVLLMPYDRSVPPYMVVNRCRDVVIRLKQLEWGNPNSAQNWDVIPPNANAPMPFAWDEPQLKHVVQVVASAQRDVQRETDLQVRTWLTLAQRCGIVTVYTWVLFWRCNAGVAGWGSGWVPVANHDLMCCALPCMPLQKTAIDVDLDAVDVGNTTIYVQSRSMQPQFMPISARLDTREKLKYLSDNAKKVRCGRPMCHADAHALGVG